MKALVEVELRFEVYIHMCERLSAFICQALIHSNIMARMKSVSSLENMKYCLLSP